MSRELVIRFKEDGEWVQEIEEERHYYLIEVEEIVQKLRKRLVKEKRELEQKAFSLLVDGKEVLHSYISIKSSESRTIQEQITQTIANYEAWEESVRQKYVNKVNEYAENERQAFLNPEFRMFVIRLDEVLEAKFGLTQSKYLFDRVYANLSTGFFSKMEEVVTSVVESYQTVLQSIADKSIEWFSDKENFNSFGQYVSANYQSVSKNRLAGIQVQYSGYHKLQDYLFTLKAANRGFSEAQSVHKSMKVRFLLEWDKILLQGFPLKDEDMVKSLLIAPIIQSYFQEEIKNEDLTKEEKKFIVHLLNIDRGEDFKNDEKICIS